MPEPVSIDPEMVTDDVLYIKMNVYQRVLGELEGLKTNLNKIKTYHKQLQTTEYNEEASFEKLRRSAKTIHDRLLYADKILFKPQG